MPKINLNNAFATQSTPERKKLASDATALMTGGGIDFNTDKSLLNVKSLKLSEVLPREINEFNQENVESLADSIKEYGLISPISVVHDDVNNTYTISSGHRRYAAMCLLHEWEPNNKDYETIDCSVYELTDDKMLLAQGIPYISREQEEGIYRDSNLESRQLTYTDVAHQIRYIVKKFDDEEYVAKLRQRAEAKGIKTRVDYDKAKLIMSVLSTQQYSGWKKETIRQYLKICESQRQDLIEGVESGQIKVSVAYKTMIQEQNRKRNRKTNKIIALRKAVSDFVKEASKKEYTEDECNEIKKMIGQLEELLKQKEDD